MPSRCLAFFTAALLAALPSAIRADPAHGAQSATRVAVAESLPWPADPAFAPTAERVSALTRLGRQMFNDPALSASGRMSCATCHDPAHAFGPPNDLPVQFGGKHLDQPGTRAVPSLMYGAFTPPFTEHFFDEDRGDVDQGPAGGRTWDGRVNRTRDQVRIPLLAANEMANESPAALADAVKSAPYEAEFRALFGDKVLDDPNAVLDGLGASLEAYLEYQPEFSPYSSKYDAFLAGTAELTAQEARGLALFNDQQKGNCANCHFSSVSTKQTLPNFTDYGLVAIGVPRNPAIPANADPNYFDMGLCGPVRTDLRENAENCGLFKAPTLRNVATRKVFYHNGVFHSLTEAVRFYAERDTNPEKWYSRNADGSVRKFDDLPVAFHGNVNDEPPFDRKPGDAPALSEEEIADIVAFLGTLTDGYKPPRQAGVGVPSRTQ